MHKTWFLVETDEDEITIAMLMFEFKKCDSALFYYQKSKYDDKKYENFDIFYFDILRKKFWKIIDKGLKKIGIL